MTYGLSCLICGSSPGGPPWYMLDTIMHDRVHGCPNLPLLMGGPDWFTSLPGRHESGNPI